MTDYVEHGGENALPGPMTCAQTTMYAFFTRGSGEKLGQLCEKMFSEPSAGNVRCTPLLAGPLVVSFGTIAAITGPTPPHDAMGPMHERHACVWLPVRCEGPEGSDTPRGGAALPYIWIDNPISFASGRENYGYAKSWGWAEFEGCRPGDDTKDARPTSFTLDVFGYDRKGESPGPKRLLEIHKRGHPEAPEPTEVSDKPSDVVALGLEKLSEDDPELRSLTAETADLNELFLEGVDQMFLRQFRRLVAPGSGEPEGEAKLSEIVTAGAKVVPGTFRAQRIGWHDLEVHQMASQPVTSELGLGPRASAYGVRIIMDFTVERGRVLWSG